MTQSEINLNLFLKIYQLKKTSAYKLFLVSCLVMLYLHLGIHVNPLSYTWNAFSAAKRIMQCAAPTFWEILDFEIFLGGNPHPPRGSCGWHSLFPLPTFIVKLSTPKLVENPENITVIV